MTVGLFTSYGKTIRMCKRLTVNKHRVVHFKENLTVAITCEVYYWRISK